MWLMSVVKPRVEPSPTFRLKTQVVMKAIPWWFELGPQLGESSHLKVHLEGHVKNVIVGKDCK